MDRIPALGLLLTSGRTALPGATVAAVQTALTDVVVVRADDAEPDELVALFVDQPLVVLVDVRCDGVTAELIRESIAGFDGISVVFVQPVLETLKLARDGHVVRTVDREQVRVVATPVVATGATMAAVPDLVGALADPAALVAALRALGPVDLREAPPQVRRSSAGSTSDG